VPLVTLRTAAPWNSNFSQRGHRHSMQVRTLSTLARSAGITVTPHFGSTPPESCCGSCPAAADSSMGS
jgi:hypothetical protein